MAQVYTIQELSAEVGGDVTPRTIRYYIAEGLLPKPDERGQYTSGHLRRLQLIRKYREAFVPLEKIRSQIVTLTDAQIAERLEASEAPLATAESAAEYTARLLTEYQEKQVIPASRRPHPLTTGPDLDETLRLHRRLNAPTAASVAPESPDPDAETWERLHLAPGIELHIRRPLPQASQDYLDALLTHTQKLRKPGA